MVHKPVCSTSGHWWLNAKFEPSTNRPRANRTEVTVTFVTTHQAMVKLLGAPSAIGDGGSVLSGPRRLAVLAYLVLARPRGMHTRDTLMTMFWPDADTSSGRHALRNVLHAIRSALGADVLITAGDTLVGVSPDRIECDVLTVEKLIAANQLDLAADDVDAELLTGFYITGAPAFEHWLDSERTRLRTQLTAAWRDCAVQSRDRRDIAGAIRFARRALAQTPDDEGLLRFMLDVMGEGGEIAAALRAYDEFATTLREEFSVEPHHSTKAIAERLRSTRSLHPVDDDVLRDLYARGTYLFLRGAPVGNIADLQQCRELFQQALERQPGFAQGIAGLSNYFAVAAVRDIMRPFDAAFNEAIELSHRALALDPSLAIPHVHFGIKALYLDDDWAEGGRQFAEATTLDPEYAEARRFLGVFLEGIGRADLAITEHRAAVRLEPHIALFRNSLSATLMNVGALDEAIEQLQYAVALDPNYLAARDRLLRCFERLARYEEAVDVRVRHQPTATAQQFIDAFARDGAGGYLRMRQAELREYVATLSARVLAGPTGNAADLLNPPQLRLALAYAELGEWEQAARWERHACRNRPGLRQWFVSHPDLAPLYTSY